MHVRALVLLFVSAVLAVAITSSVTSADEHGYEGVYGCFLTNGEVFWDGYIHPAAFEGFGGPGILMAIVGPECDEYLTRADYEEDRLWSPEFWETNQTPEPTPEPTPTPIPPPIEIGPWPWPSDPFCFWNDRSTVLFCYG